MLYFRKQIIVFKPIFVVEYGEKLNMMHLLWTGAHSATEMCVLLVVPITSVNNICIDITWTTDTNLTV